MKRKFLATTTLIVCLGMIGRAEAQIYAPPPAPGGQILAPAQLDQMLGPIALYPDPLIAEMLPAATQPVQITLAYSYIASGGDPNAVDQQNWDSSVKAMTRYPDVLKMLNDYLPWTTELGQAYVNQVTDVMNSIQRLRAQAQQLGNLTTTPQENVVVDDGTIEILPPDPNMLYVPTYDPAEVYYVRPFGRSFLSFGLGFAIGGWLDFDFDWHRHGLINWGRDRPRPSNWWRERPTERRDFISRAPVWHPESRGSAHSPIAARGDRGYVNREIHPEAPREIRPTPHPVAVRPTPARVETTREAPARPARIEPPARVEPPKEVRPPARPVEVRPPPARVEPPRATQPPPRPAQVYTPPARQAPSAFSGGHSAPDTRAASSRGADSRQTGGGNPGNGQRKR